MIAVIGGVNFLPFAFFWILQLSAPPGEDGGFLFVGLMVVSLVGTIALSAVGAAVAIIALSLRSHSNAPAIVALAANAMPVVGYALIFGIAAILAFN